MHEIKLDKKNLLSNIDNIIDKNFPIMSNLANVSRVLYETFDNTLWSGFYLISNDCQKLILGPFQGPLACLLIPIGKGVCGVSAYEKRPILVPNVHLFPGHIACSSLSNSEIVVPIMKDNKVLGVIDLDSELFDNYTQDDERLLVEVARIISEIL